MGDRDNMIDRTDNMRDRITLASIIYNQYSLRRDNYTHLVSKWPENLTISQNRFRSLTHYSHDHALSTYPYAIVAIG